MKKIKFWCVAMVLVTVTMLLGMPQNAKAAANPPKVIETRVGPNQCVAIPGVTKVRVRQLAPSKKEIDYKLFWNGNERVTYEYCTAGGAGTQYTLKPGETQTYTPSYAPNRRVEITNLNRYSLDYSDVLVVEDLTPFDNASSGKAEDQAIGSKVQQEAARQPAPIPRIIIQADNAPKALSGWFAQLAQGEKNISIDGAQWLQLQFDDYQLGDNGTLTIRDAAGQTQTFTQSQLEDWEGLTAIFNGSQLTVSLAPSCGNNGELYGKIGKIIIGLPSQGENWESVALSIPQSLRNILGEDLRQYIPLDLPRLPSEEAPGKTICSSDDNRQTSYEPWVGRIMPVGCTGWIIEGGKLLSAGHCYRNPDSFQTIEFNVPPSQSNGTTVSPPVSDQYRVISQSIDHVDNGPGYDWLVFEVQENTETGLKPEEAQEGAYSISNSVNPSTVTIAGYGVDGPPPGFGNGPGNADNQTLQSDFGLLTSEYDDITLTYFADTMGGNSGSPVIDSNNPDIAIGIHTHGGCPSQPNKGTSFRNEDLWQAVGGQ